MSITTKDFKSHIAYQFYESLTEPANNIYYVFAGRNLPWTDDLSPPEEQDTNYDVIYNTYDNMSFGKRITSNNISMMINRNNWTSNTVYDIYDDRVDLSTKTFYVVVDANTSFDVFKCLNNCDGKVSTIEPNRAETSESDEFYSTSDGYQWKYLYSVDLTTFNQFATDSYIPLIENANTVANSINGALDVILIETVGSQYNSYANGYFQSVNVGGDSLVHTIEATSSANTDFFKNSAIKITEGVGAGQQRTITEYIVTGGQRRVVIDASFDITPDNSSKYEISPLVLVIGDGIDCVARAIVNATSNTLSSIEISNRGSGYSYATATVYANTGIIDINTSNAIIANNATLRVIIPPVGGHGSNVASELQSTHVGISLVFANNESNTIPSTNQFRTYGIIKDPLYANVQLIISSIVGDFVDDEVVTANTGAFGTVTYYDNSTSTLRLANVWGDFSAGLPINGGSSNASATISNTFISGVEKSFNTFDQRTRFDITHNNANTFDPNVLVTQISTSANAYVYDSNTTSLTVTNVKGTFNTGTYPVTTANGASANISSIAFGDLVKYSGKILYMDNIQPVTRANTTSEIVKITIGF